MKKHDQAYVPASSAKVRVSKDGNTFTAVLQPGLRIKVSRADFIEQNQILSALYFKERDAERRGEIAHQLYLLDLPLFKEWDLFIKDGKEDYRQDAFLWTTMALEKYNPEKGSFIHWLRLYIRKAREEAIYFRDNGRLKVDDEIADEEGEEPEFDSALSLNRLKVLMPPERWQIIEMKVLRGMTIEEIAARLKISRETARTRIDDAVNSVRMGVTASAQRGHDNILSDGSVWLSKAQFCSIMGLHGKKLECMLRKGTRHILGKFMINKKSSYSPLNRGRIRYKESKDGGLIYPEFIERPLALGARAK